MGLAMYWPLRGFFKLLTPANSLILQNQLGVLQFRSDTECLELAQTPTHKGSVSQDCTHFRGEPQGLGAGATHTSYPVT